MPPGFTVTVDPGPEIASDPPAGAPPPLSITSVPPGVAETFGCTTNRLPPDASVRLFPTVAVFPVRIGTVPTLTVCGVAPHSTYPDALNVSVVGETAAATLIAYAPSFPPNTAAFVGDVLVHATSAVP